MGGTKKRPRAANRNDTSNNRHATCVPACIAAVAAVAVAVAFGGNIDLFPCFSTLLFSTLHLTCSLIWQVVPYLRDVHIPMLQNSSCRRKNLLLRNKHRRMESKNINTIDSLHHIHLARPRATSPKASFWKQQRRMLPSTSKHGTAMSSPCPHNNGCPYFCADLVLANSLTLDHRYPLHLLRYADALQAYQQVIEGEGGSSTAEGKKRS